MGLIILNYGQTTMTTPDPAHVPPYFHSTPTGGRLALSGCNLHQAHIHGGFFMELGPETKILSQDHRASKIPYVVRAGKTSLLDKDRNIKS
ncbi:hypothetical protein AVEN_39815-1 [Araneus ventricosus]|uniref:Uncharacterized protein n=1 Tax=Araneus ventricosus TaxID=182803 RepID=A0A4Y2LIB6_ARAVE|nr:hypothetical protein AVEN_39815-1 [Araneus ventricosus]